MTGNAAARHGSTVIVVAVVELAHVELAGGGAALGAVGAAVDHHRARAADALAAVVVEGDRLRPSATSRSLSTSNSSRNDMSGLTSSTSYVLERAGRGRAGLAPDAELEVHGLQRFRLYL